MTAFTPYSVCSGLEDKLQKVMPPVASTPKSEPMDLVSIAYGLRSIKYVKVLVKIEFILAILVIFCQVTFPQILGINEIEDNRLNFGLSFCVVLLVMVLIVILHSFGSGEPTKRISLRLCAILARIVEIVGHLIISAFIFYEVTYKYEMMKMMIQSSCDQTGKLFAGMWVFLGLLYCYIGVTSVLIAIIDIWLLWVVLEDSSGELMLVLY